MGQLVSSVLLRLTDASIVNSSTAMEPNVLPALLDITLAQTPTAPSALQSLQTVPLVRELELQHVFLVM